MDQIDSEKTSDSKPWQERLWILVNVSATGRDTWIGQLVSFMFYPFTRSLRDHVKYSSQDISAVFHVLLSFTHDSYGELTGTVAKALALYESYSVSTRSERYFLKYFSWFSKRNVLIIIIEKHPYPYSP